MLAGARIFLVFLVLAGLHGAAVGAQQSALGGVLPSDGQLAELTPVALAPGANQGRRVFFEAQRHYQAARAAALGREPAAYARESAAALALCPEAGEIFLLRATQEVAAARYEDALWSLAQAQRLHPGLGFSGTILAGTLNDMRRYEEAFLVLRDLEAPEAGSWQTIYERARAEIGMGNLSGAELWSQRLLTAAPASFAAAHLVRGQALALAARWEEARAEFALYPQSVAGKSRLDAGSADGARDAEAPQTTIGELAVRAPR